MSKVEDPPAFDYVNAWHGPMSLYVRVVLVGKDTMSMSQAMNVPEQFPGVISVECRREKMRIQCAKNCSIDALCNEIGKNCNNGDTYIHAVKVYVFPD